MEKSENVQFILEDFLPYKLNVIAQMVSKSFSETYGESFNISVPEWRVIAHLNQRQNVSIREIAEEAYMPKAKVTRAVQILEARKWVKKVVDPDDRRLVRVRLTNKGQKRFNEIAPLALEFEANILKNLSKELRADAKILVDALLTVIRSGDN